MWTSHFWLCVAERSIKTLAQAAAAALIAAGTGLIDTNWVGILSVAGMAALISILTSIASGEITGGQTSLLSTEVVTDPLARRAIVEDEGHGDASGNH
jgi:hypothetical protein